MTDACAKTFTLPRAAVIGVLLTLLATHPATLAERVIAAADLPGEKAHLGSPESIGVMLTAGSFTAPLNPAPGRTRIEAHLSYNGKGKAFATSTVAMWCGPFAATRSIAELTDDDTLTLSFVARKTMSPGIHFAVQLSPAAQDELLALQRTAAEQKRQGSGDGTLTLRDDDASAGMEGLAESPAAAEAVDASTSLLPMVLVHSVSVSALPAPSAVPEIANIVPYIRLDTPSMILGEQLDDGELELRTWQPPTGEAEIRAGAEALVTGRPAVLPPLPPKSAQTAALLDRDRQLVLAELPGDAVWVRNRHGWSAPYLARRAMPFWISDEQAVSGQPLFVCGYGLREPGGQAHVLLRAEDRILFADVLPEPPGDDNGDRYRVTFRVPAQATTGSWEVWLNNAAAGRYGWVRGPTIRVLAPQPDIGLFDVTEFGANGMDEANDLAAIQAAMAAAAEAGGGTVELPAGRYLVDRTIVLPAGVSLRGADQERTVIEGFGYSPAAEVDAEPPPVLIQFSDRSGVSAMTLCGAVASGVRGWHRYPMLLVSQVSRVRIEDCIVEALQEDPATMSPLYRHAIWVRDASWVRLAGNRCIMGMVIDGSRRVDLLRNLVTWAEGELVSVTISRARDSLFEANVLAEHVSRWCPIAGGAHNIYLRNELHHKFVGEVGSNEGYLFHGNIPAGFSPEQVPEQAGQVLKASADRLQARRAFRHVNAAYRGTSLAGATVEIVSGRGFGQYRIVQENSDDTVVVDRPWEVVPDVTSWFVLKNTFTENAVIGNVNDSHSPNCLYYDQIGSIFEHQRSRHNYTYFMGDSAMTGGSEDPPRDTTHPGVSYFNLFCHWDYEAGYLEIDGQQTGEPLREHAPLFANFFVANRIAQSPQALLNVRGSTIAKRACINHGTNGYGVIKGGDAVGINWPGESHSVFAHNTFVDSPIGLRNGVLSRKTFLYHNRFENVDDILVDVGGETVLQGNLRLTTSAAGATIEEAVPDAVNPSVIVPWQTVRGHK